MFKPLCLARVVCFCVCDLVLPPCWSSSVVTRVRELERRVVLLESEAAQKFAALGSVDTPLAPCSESTDICDRIRVLEAAVARAKKRRKAKKQKKPMKILKNVAVGAVAAFAVVAAGAAIFASRGEEGRDKKQRKEKARKKGNSKVEKLKGSGASRSGQVVVSNERNVFGKVKKLNDAEKKARRAAKLAEQSRAADRAAVDGALMVTTELLHTISTEEKCGATLAADQDINQEVVEEVESTGHGAPMVVAVEKTTRSRVVTLNLGQQLGLTISPAGEIEAVVPGSQAEAQGIPVGAQIAAAWGERTSTLKGIKAAIARGRVQGTQTLELTFTTLETGAPLVPMP